ncbi:hypothetical protein [Hymenobacter sp. HDW8]|uniref:hypothetical protein n=1 Tax=Hymenobacter sp. HDW8 TaxID=2714932 RepID=UPI00140A3FA3|nr:hypothetical protein [Hymenobacter sp. HDW8]QIL75998.1 hypothetical protein G7064_09115 [Hymenobacter sp. HDW8]
MKTSFLPRILLLGGIFAVSLTSCSTGTDPGETNVESGSAKEQVNENKSDANDPDDKLYTTSDAATNGATADTSTVKTGKQVYDEADDRRDENVDGKAGPQ